MIAQRKDIIALTVSPIANDNRVLNHTKSLASEGHDVTLLCPAKGVDSRKFGFKIKSVEIASRKLPGIFGIVKAFEFYLKGVVYSRKLPCDVLHCNDLYGLVLGRLIQLSIHKESIIVYDAHEYETEMNGLTGFKKLLFKVLERRLIRHVKRIITVSDSIADEYQRLYRVEKPVVILNVPKQLPPSDSRHNLFREGFGIRQNQRIFLYQGNLMPGRGIEILLEVFNKMKDDSNVIVFMGKGQLEDKIKESGSPNIFFQEFKGPSEYLFYTSSADVGVSFIEDISLSDRYCLPNKLFEYIFCGLPVICSNLPEMKKLVESEEIGIVAQENTSNGFREAIEKLDKLDISSFALRLDHAAKRYSWDRQKEKLINLYLEV